MTDEDDGELERPAPGCDPFCINCRGGQALYHARKSDKERCILCGGHIPPYTDEHHAVSQKVGEMGCLLNLFKTQHDLADPMRSFTVGRMKRTLDDIELLEAGQKRREHVTGIPRPPEK